MTKSILTPNEKELHNLRQRSRKEKRFRLYGASAIGFTLLFLVFLLGSIFISGIGAFSATHIRLDIHFSAETLDPSGTRLPDDLVKADYAALVRDSLKTEFPEVTARPQLMKLYGLVSKQSSEQLRAMVAQNPALIGTSAPVWLVASSKADLLRKNGLDSTEDLQGKWLEKLQKGGAVKTRFNSIFFTSADSREPEQAGILGAAMGSIFLVIACLALAFPLGVLTAVYLEEFAPKNTFTDIIEVNINNLAAVPSIVFGLLGLWLYLNIMHLPRSSALVGGLTLALMVLPILIITTRNSLKSVPPSVRDAARALGASPLQVVVHHTLPLALPGIMTGTILSIARALGETAPLIMIGMVAFIADVPQNMLSPATAMPVQIYLWSDSPEAGFRERTSAAIMVLLIALIIINVSAAWVRKKFERKW